MMELNNGNTYYGSLVLFSTSQCVLAPLSLLYFAM